MKSSRLNVRVYLSEEAEMTKEIVNYLKPYPLFLVCGIMNLLY